MSRALLGFLLFCLVLATGAAFIAWYVGSAATAVAFDAARRGAPYFLVQLIPQGSAIESELVGDRRAGFVLAASADGARRIWSADATRRHESRSGHGSYRGAMEAVDVYAFDRGGDLVQLLTGAQFRALAADPELPTLLAGTPTPPQELDPDAVAVLVLYEVAGGNLRRPLGEPGRSGWLAALDDHRGRVAWDAPIDWIRGGAQWNRLLLLQFPDAATAAAWLRDPATLTERAIASRYLGDLLVLVAVPGA